MRASRRKRGINGNVPRECSATSAARLSFFLGYMNVALAASTLVSVLHRVGRTPFEANTKETSTRNGGDDTLAIPRISDQGRLLLSISSIPCAGEPVTAQLYDNVTIIFSDVVGFTGDSWSDLWCVPHLI